MRQKFSYEIHTMSSDANKWPNEFVVRNKKIDYVKFVPTSEVDGFHDSESIASCFAKNMNHSLVM